MKTKPPRPANAGPPRSGRRVGRGAIPRPVKVDTPFPHAGPAPRVAAPSGSLREGDTSLGQVQANSKRSPLKINPQAERGVWCFGGLSRRGFKSQRNTPPLSRARWGLPRKSSPRNPRLCVPHRARRFKAATSSLLCRHTGRVTAAKQHPSGRLRRCPTGSAYAERKARRFSAKQARRKSAPRVAARFAATCGRGIRAFLTRAKCPKSTLLLR